MEGISPNIINNMIPCITNHVAVFNDGSKYQIIGWASRTTRKKIAGDIEPYSEVCGLITFNGDIRVAEDCDGFTQYEESSQDQKVTIQ